MDNQTSPTGYDSELDISELFSLIWTARKLIFITTLVTCFISIFIALLLPKYWVSAALLSPVEPAEISSGPASSSFGLNSIASITGLNLSQQSSEASITVAMLNSRDFLNHLLTIDSVPEGLMAIRGYDERLKQNVFKNDLYNKDEESWVNEAPSSWESYKVYRRTLTASLDPLSGFVSISVKHRSPLFAKFFLETALREINLLSREKDLLASQAALDFLYKLLDTTVDRDMRIMLSGMIQSQVKIQMLAKIQDNYVLEPIAEPFFPEERDSPKRKRIVLLGILSGFIAGLLISIVQYYGVKHRIIGLQND
ncbi:Wzz/FepE/Etk N-terminal domain-containing protein [Gammaproteobacteria bacterium]|nr:Wzz/FepE/Etk N-terminal domain-containing protein [Gammaproteobacteria bacterium]